MGSKPVLDGLPFLIWRKGQKPRIVAPSEDVCCRCGLPATIKVCTDRDTQGYCVEHGRKYLGAKNDG